MSKLLDELLAKPAAPTLPGRRAQPSDFTSMVELSNDTAHVTVRDTVGSVDETRARDILVAEGLNPDEFEVASLKRSQWGAPDSLMESTSYTFRRVSGQGESREPLDLEELVALAQAESRHADLTHGTTSWIVALGDMQVGKMDLDGPEGAVSRAVRCIDEAALDIELWCDMDYPPDHIHVAWLGDHIEGFVSQGGANVWRTPLTLNEQIRVVRRIMLYAVQRLAPLCRRLTMAAVPGNHGEPQRFNGKGVTRYDDSHDTESLIAVSEAVALNPSAYQHVEFYVPQTDEMTVLLEVGGMNIAHVHGHQWRPGKHFEWWKGQAFNKDSAMHVADVLLAGHLHHMHVERDGPRTYVGVPALEGESTWWRHATGTGGHPGILLLAIEDRRIINIRPIEVTDERDA